MRWLTSDVALLLGLVRLECADVEEVVLWAHVTTLQAPGLVNFAAPTPPDLITCGDDDAAVSTYDFDQNAAGDLSEPGGCTLGPPNSPRLALGLQPNTTAVKVGGAA